MKITLPDHTKSYGLFDRILLADPNAGRNCRGGNFYIPTSTEEAANATVSVLIGQANAGKTAIDQPEYPPMTEGFNYNIPQDIKNSYSLTSRFIQASVDNAVITINLLYA